MVQSAYRASNTNVLVLEMLEEFELSVCALRQHRCAERLHDLLDGDILSCELVFGGAGELELSAGVAE